MQLKDIRKAMLGFSASELDEVCRFAKAISANGIAAVSSEYEAAKAEDIGRMILDRMCAVMQERDLDPTKAHSLLTNIAYKQFRRKVTEDQIGEWLGHVVKHNRTGLWGLIGLCVNLLVDDLITKGSTPNTRALMLHVHRLPVVLNRSFPGYARFGMLGMIIRKEGK